MPSGTLKTKIDVIVAGMVLRLKDLGEEQYAKYNRLLDYLNSVPLSILILWILDQITH